MVTETRDRVVDTVLLLLDEGDVDPSVDRVAERSGVDRHIVRGFLADREAMLNDMVNRRLAQLDPWLEPFPPDAPLEDRIAALVTRRSVLLEWLTPARLAAMRHEPFSPKLRVTRDAMFSAAKDRVAGLFAAELDPLPAVTREALLNALDAVTMWGSWYHWRSSGLDTEQASRAMAVAVSALLAAAVAAKEPA